MYRHRLGIVGRIRIPDANSISDPHFGREIGALFHDMISMVLSDAIVIANIADKQTVDAGATRADRKIFRVLWLESRHKDFAHVAAHQFVMKNRPVASESLM